MSAKIIAAFPACGKSMVYNTYSIYSDQSQYKNKKIIDLDADDTLFKWKLNEFTNITYVSHYDFPNNFITFINNHSNTEDIIFVSAYDQILDALNNYGIEYYLIYPDRSLKSEWLNRFINRNNSDGFINMIDSNWDTFMDRFDNEIHPIKIKLNSGMYITLDLINSI